MKIRMKHLAFSAGLIAIAAGGQAQVHAQEMPYNASWYIAPNVNAIDSDNRFGFDKNGRGVGLRFGKPIQRYWDIQMGGNSTRTKEGAQRYHQDIVGIDALIMFSRSAMRPYFLFGSGLEMDKTQINGVSRSKNSAFYNFGLGLQADITDRLAFQADIRRLQGQLKLNDFGFRHAKTNQLSVGLNYSFDLATSTR